MLSRESIIYAERVRNGQTKLIHDYASSKKHTQKTLDDWQKAADDFHNTELAPDYLWSDETQRKIKDGNRDVIGDTLLFLEVDPYYFRSGYLKERLLDSLKRAPLTENDKARIRRIIIKAVSGPTRREFRRYCKLAARVTSVDFEDQIEQLGNEKTGGKCSYLLDYLRKHRTS